MTKSADLDFAVQRNEDFGPFVFTIRDTDKAPVDLSGWTFSLVVDYSVGRTSDPALRVDKFPNANGSYIDLNDGKAGELELFISRDDLDALAGEADDFVGFAHNLIASDEVGYERVIARGKFTAEPGV